MTTLSAIVLAGGQSSRMGQDKALIPIEGETRLLQKVCQVAAACSDLVYIVTPWRDRYQPFLPDHYHWIDETSLPDETLPHGPLVGFAQGLAEIQSEWVLLLACDLPRLQIAALRHWAAQLDTVPTEAIAFLAKQPQGWEPLCGFYRQQCLPALTAYIAQGGRSFQRWLAQQPVQEMPVEDSQIFFNCNTPEDLQALQDLNEKAD